MTSVWPAQSQSDADETSHKETLGDMRSAARMAPPTVAGIRGIASVDKMSIFSAIPIGGVDLDA